MYCGRGLDVGFVTRPDVLKNANSVYSNNFCVCHITNPTAIHDHFYVIKNDH